MAKQATPKRVRLKPADPFDLIRLLARTQNDPRKAVAELVQNSIDARAKRIRISRLRIRGSPALSVEDDGEGVLPEMERQGALHFIATHIGHSRKLNLTPRERMVFELRHYQGLRLRSIGEMLGTTEEAAKNCLFRATQKMRAVLGDFT